ncbi:putative btb poz domain protein [Neofusicoccum parvum]|nr:putative btb poz domain protein [Neofusicoccum parvum]
MAPTNAPGLLSLLETGQLSDIVIKFGEDRELKAHKVILAAKSGWFHLLSTAASSGDDPDALEFALQFLYHENLELRPHDSTEKEATLFLLTLYEISNKYDIPSLANPVASGLIPIFRRGLLLDYKAEIVRALYDSVSHDGHGLKETLVWSLTLNLRRIEDELKEYAKENKEFAADVLFSTWSWTDKIISIRYQAE